MYSQKIFRVCLGYFNDVDKAKDVTQDVFINVFENLKTLKHYENVSGWIYRIASNKCLRQIENEKRIQLVDHYDVFKIEDIENSTKEERFIKLHQCISSLPEIDRIIIGLYLEDLSQKDIAEVVGLSHANIRVRVHRIKEVLTEKMQHNE